MVIYWEYIIKEATKASAMIYAFEKQCLEGVTIHTRNKTIWRMTEGENV